MKIELPTEIIDIIDEVLNDYCNGEDYHPIDASRALRALRNAVEDANNLEELRAKIKEECPKADTSIADFMNERINEVALKGLKKMKECWNG